MTTSPAEVMVGIKSIRVSGVATHPVTIKLRVFGSMNYRVKIRDKDGCDCKRQPQAAERI